MYSCVGVNPVCNNRTSLTHQPLSARLPGASLLMKDHRLSTSQSLDVIWSVIDQRPSTIQSLRRNRAPSDRHSAPAGRSPCWTNSDSSCFLFWIIISLLQVQPSSLLFPELKQVQVSDPDLRCYNTYQEKDPGFLFSHGPWFLVNINWYYYCHKCSEPIVVSESSHSLFYQDTFGGLGDASNLEQQPCQDFILLLLSRCRHMVCYTTEPVTQYCVWTCDCGNGQDASETFRLSFFIFWYCTVLWILTQIQ